MPLNVKVAGAWQGAASQVKVAGAWQIVERLYAKVAGVWQLVSDPWGLSTASYDGVSFSITPQDTTPTGVAFKPDGTKMYVIGTENDAVYQYTLSTPWSLSTATYDSVAYSVAAQEVDASNITFKPDGTKMYVVGVGSDAVLPYTLSTPWNLSTASYDGVSFGLTSPTVIPESVAFKLDGTKMYVLGGGGGDAMYQYTLPTPWNVVTASYDSVSFSVYAQDTAPTGVTFRPDGAKMYVVGVGNDAVYQYTLSTPWDLTTASYDSVSFSVAAQASGPTCIAFKPNGTGMYILGIITEAVYQYSLD